MAIERAGRYNSDKGKTSRRSDLPIHNEKSSLAGSIPPEVQDAPQGQNDRGDERILYPINHIVEPEKPGRFYNAPKAADTSSPHPGRREGLEGDIAESSEAGDRQQTPPGKSDLTLEFTKPEQHESISSELHTEKDLDDSYDAASTDEGASSRTMLSQYLMRVVTKFPYELTNEQARVLFTAREREKEFVNEKGYTLNPDERNKLFDEVRFSPTFERTITGENRNTFDHFDAAFEASRTIDEVIANCCAWTVIKEAKRRTTTSMTLGDKFQEGFIGLIKKDIAAYDHRNPPEGVNFMQYITLAVRDTISTAAGESEKLIRIPHSTRTAIKKVHKISRDFEDDNGNAIATNELVGKLKKESTITLTDTRAREIVLLANGASNVDESVVLDGDEETNPLIERFAQDAPSVTPEFSSAFLDAVAGDFTEQDLEVIVALYGDGVSIKTAAERLGVSVSVVTNARSRILDQLAVHPAVVEMVDETIGEHEGALVYEENESSMPSMDTNMNTENEVSVAKNPALSAADIYAPTFDILKTANASNRADLLAEAVTSVQALTTTETARFADMLLNDLGNSSSEFEVLAQLRILSGLDIDKENSKRIMGAYNARLQLVAEVDAQTLLEAGTILAGKVVVDSDVRAKTQRALGKYIRSADLPDEARRDYITQAARILKAMERRLAPAEGVMNEFLEERLGEFYGGTLDQHGNYTEGTKQHKIRKDAHDALNRMSHVEATALITKLIQGIGSDNEQWDVNRRDTANDILQMVDFTKVDTEAVRKSYYEALRNQPYGSDPLGSIYSLIEAGKIIMPHLPQTKETRDGFNAAYNSASKHVAHTKEWEDMWAMANVVSNHGILEQWKSGEPAAAIAESYGIEKGSVYQIIERLRAAGEDVGHRERVWQKTAGVPDLSDAEQQLVTVYEETMTVVETNTDMGAKERQKTVVQARRAVVDALRSREDPVPVRQISRLLGDIPLPVIKNDVYKAVERKASAEDPDESAE